MTQFNSCSQWSNRFPEKNSRRSISAPIVTVASHVYRPVVHAWLISGIATRLARIRSRSPRRACIYTFKERAMHRACQPRLACLGRPLLRSSLIHWWHQLVNHVECYFRVPSSTSRAWHESNYWFCISWGILTCAVWHGSTSTQLTSHNTCGVILSRQYALIYIHNKVETNDYIEMYEIFNPEIRGMKVICCHVNWHSSFLNFVYRLVDTLSAYVASLTSAIAVWHSCLATEMLWNKHMMWIWVSYRYCQFCVIWYIWTYFSVRIRKAYHMLEYRPYKSLLHWHKNTIETVASCSLFNIWPGPWGAFWFHCTWLLFCLKAYI
jgi:hypothetical protein